MKKSLLISQELLGYYFLNCGPTHVVSPKGAVPLILVHRKDASSQKDPSRRCLTVSRCKRNFEDCKKKVAFCISQAPIPLSRDEFDPGAQNCRNIKVKMHLCKERQVSDRISSGRSCCCVATRLHVPLLHVNLLQPWADSFGNPCIFNVCA